MMLLPGQGAEPAELARLRSECCRCEKCGYVQAEPNWCHECGHRTSHPEWASKLLGELSTALDMKFEAENRLSCMAADIRRVLHDHGESKASHA